MPRGGKRDKAGRKSSWKSGAKFEDTILIRVPKNIKNQLLEIAHKLDEGETIELVAKSKKQGLQSNLEAITNDINNFLNSLDEFVSQSKKDFDNIKPLQAANKAKGVLAEIKKIVKQEKNKYKIDEFVSEIVTNSEIKDKNVNNQSKNHLQLELIDVKVDSKKNSLKPLSAIELSNRFGKSKNFVSERKRRSKLSLEEFANQLKEFDPEGVAWLYREKDRKYYPIVE